MPKIQYVCEKCGGRYDCEVDAKACEDSHGGVVERIISAHYTPSEKYAISVSIMMNDGKAFKFNRDEELSARRS